MSFFKKIILPIGTVVIPGAVFFFGIRILIQTRFPEGYLLEPTWVDMGSKLGAVLASIIGGCIASLPYSSTPITSFGQMGKWATTLLILFALSLLTTGIGVGTYKLTAKCQAVISPQSDQMQQIVLINMDRQEINGNTGVKMATLASVNYRNKIQEICMITTNRAQELIKEGKLREPEENNN